MPNFYDQYALVSEGLNSGDITESQLSDEALAIYGLGKGDITVDQIKPEIRDQIESKYGLPNFLSSVGNRISEAWGQMQRGVRQLPVEEAWRTGSVSPDVTENINNTIKGLGNIGLGALKFATGPVGNFVVPAAGESVWRALGQPGGDYGRSAAELIGGLAGGIGEAGVAAKALGAVSRAALKMEPETANVLASQITPMRGTPASTNRELGAVQENLFPQTYEGQPAKVEWLRNRQLGFQGTGEFRTVGTRDIADPETQGMIKEVTRMLGKKNLSSEERDWFESKLIQLQNQVHTVPKIKENVAPVRASDILATEAKPSFTLTGSEPGQIGLGVGPELPATEPWIARGKTVSVGTEETGAQRVAHGQLDQAGYQQELIKDLERHPILDDAQKLTKARQDYNDAMATVQGLKPPVKMATPDDTSFFMKLQNAVIKSTGGLVSAPGTGVRNFLQQGTRHLMEVPLQAYHEIMQTGSFENAWQKANTQLSSLYDQYKVRDLLELLKTRLEPSQQAKLANKGMMAEYNQYKNLKSPDWYDKTFGKAVNAANTFNTKQEMSFWHANFLASINGELAPLGMKLDSSNVGKIPSQMIQNAYEHANMMTYSSDMPDAMRKAMENAYRTPVLGLLVNEIAPFARFNYANALRDVLQFSPIGFIQASILARSQPGKAAEIMAKSILGTKLIEQAARLKQDGKTDVWEMNIPGMGVVDTRKWHPMDAYALLGEIINRPPGSPNARVTLEDYLGLMTGANRFQDTALGVLMGLQDQTPETFTQGLMQSAAQMVARWTTPAKWGEMAAALATGNPELMKDRDVMSNKFYGLDRAMANVPGLAQLLPERIDPTQQETPGPKSRTEYARKTMGLQAVEQSPLKEELKRLKFTGPQGQEFLTQLENQAEIPRGERTNIKSSVDVGDFNRKMYASTGDRELNRAANTFMREVAQPALQDFVTSSAYKDMPDPLRRLILERMIEKFREASTKVAVGQGGTAKALEHAVKSMSPTERGFLNYATR